MFFLGAPFELVKPIPYDVPQTNTGHKTTQITKSSTAPNTKGAQLYAVAREDLGVTAAAAVAFATAGGAAFAAVLLLCCCF